MVTDNLDYAVEIWDESTNILTLKMVIKYT
jgi:hypothetical protein